MKTAKFKWLVIVGAIILVSGFSTIDVLGQRPNRGGSHSSSGRGMTARPMRPNGNMGNRPPSIGHRPSGNRPGMRPPHINRPWSNYHYRPGYSYRRPYYGFYSYYRPFLGVRLSVLPFGYYPFYFGPDQFYYSGGFFYQQYDNGYKVVVPPIGAQVPSIPAEAKEISINGQTYYEYKGVYYSISTDDNGKTVYVVAGKDGVLDTDAIDPADSTMNMPQEGDVVNELPANVRDVVIKGVLYYVSEDGVYYEKVMDGDKVTYKVIGVGN